MGLGNGVYAGGKRLQRVSPNGSDWLAFCANQSDSIYVGTTGVSLTVRNDNDPMTTIMLSDE